MQGGASKACNELLVLSREASSPVHPVLTVVRGTTAGVPAVPCYDRGYFYGRKSRKSVFFHFGLKGIMKALNCHRHSKNPANRTERPQPFLSAGTWSVAADTALEMSAHTAGVSALSPCRSYS